MPKKVVIGMSGGVDSSVAAYLLKKNGYEVIGVSMLMQENNNDGAEDARKVAEKLGIEFYTPEFYKEFDQAVIETFVDEYMHGRTPNPCCLCNRQIKWEALMQWAKSLGAEYVATGHYARVDKLSNGRYAICNSATATKDQTYALCRLKQDQLEHTIMPLGDYKKEDIRRIAADIGIEVANKPDSQDICFIPDNDHAAFIQRRTGIDNFEGNFVDTEGNILGKHKGIFRYTIGQRKGLGIALGKHIFVNKIRTETNEVIVGDEDIIFTKELMADDINYMGAESLKEGERYLAKIRYAHKGEMCTVKACNDGILSLEFDNPVRAITPGQSVVLYDGDYVMASGIIM